MQRVLVPTGLAIELPGPHAVALVYARSGLSIKHGLCMANGVGVVDSDYRGELKVPMINLGTEAYTIQPGERVAQLCIAPVYTAAFAQVEELGLAHTHFSNPHGISDEDHYTSCYDMAQILRWALTQPGFETLFTRNEMYTMGPTNVQPVTRYFHQQDKMRVGSSRYYIPAILGSKIGYTNIARYSYVCLAEQNGVRLICVTMQSELSTDKYNDVRTLLDYAFSTFTG